MMETEKDLIFHVDESNFVLQRVMQDVEGLRAVTEELRARQDKDLQGFQARTSYLQHRIKEESEALKAAAGEMEARFREQIQAQQARTRGLQPNKMSMLCFSGDLDRILAAFILGTGAAAMGMEVMMFFSFWGCTALRKKKAKVKGKDIFGKMFGFMLPKGADKIKLSKMHMGGMGTGMMKFLMKRKKVDSLPQMIRTAEELGVQIYVCEMSMEIMGMKREEIVDYKGLTFAGAGKFLKEAAGTEINLFI